MKWTISWMSYALLQGPPDLMGTQMERLAPSTFEEEIVKLKGSAGTGDDMLPRLSPHRLKCTVLTVLLERFYDVDWERHSVESWTCFELLSIPKVRQQTSFKDFPAQHISLRCRGLSGVQASFRSPSWSCSYGLKVWHCFDDCFAILCEALCHSTKWKDSPLIVGSQPLSTQSNP